METNEILDVSAEDNLTPVLPLRDVVVYPHMVIPLFVGREKSIEALDKAMQENKQILLVSQKKLIWMIRTSTNYIKSEP